MAKKEKANANLYLMRAALELRNGIEAADKNRKKIVKMLLEDVKGKPHGVEHGYIKAIAGLMVKWNAAGTEARDRLLRRATDANGNPIHCTSAATARCGLPASQRSSQSASRAQTTGVPAGQYPPSPRRAD